MKKKFNFDDLEEIKNRETDTSQKNNVVFQRPGMQTKRNEIIQIPLYDEDNKMIRAFKEFINEQKVSLQEMQESGFFEKEGDVYNIIYQLKKPYEEVYDKKSNKMKKIHPQFSWVKAEKILDYFGYDIEFIFKKIN